MLVRWQLIGPQEPISFSQSESNDLIGSDSESNDLIGSTALRVLALEILRYLVTMVCTSLDYKLLLKIHHTQG